MSTKISPDVTLTYGSDVYLRMRVLYSLESHRRPLLVARAENDLLPYGVHGQ